MCSHKSYNNDTCVFSTVIERWHLSVLRASASRSWRGPPNWTPVPSTSMIGWTYRSCRTTSHPTLTTSSSSGTVQLNVRTPEGCAWIMKEGLRYRLNNLIVNGVSLLYRSNTWVGRPKLIVNSSEFRLYFFHHHFFIFFSFACIRLLFLLFIVSQ